MSDLVLARRSEALQLLSTKCREDMRRRWPKIDFDAACWPLKTQYKTKMLDVLFEPAILEFEGRDESYLLALRCLTALAALDGKVAGWAPMHWTWRQLADRTEPLASIRTGDLRLLEEKKVGDATPITAGTVLGRLKKLGRLLDDLAQAGAVEHLKWSPSPKAKTDLRRLELLRKKEFKTAKGAVLDRQIEAFSEATAAMLRADERLSPVDRSAIAVTNIMMCAPSRINEPLCLHVDDRFNLESFAQRSDDRNTDEMHSAHQLLMMKGSKGAQWAPKPILNFMIGLADECWRVLLENGKRSRMLLKWYEEHPDTLFLPPELEELRGRPVTMQALWQIANLECTPPPPKGSGIDGRSKGIWASILRSEGDEKPVELVMVGNHRKHRSDGKRNGQWNLPAIAWHHVESYLLRRVHERMAAMRRVAGDIFYEGKLSEMLVLVDTIGKTAYLPQAWDSKVLRLRLKAVPSKADHGPTVFQKLGLTMSEGGKEVDCYIDTHDTRRWLTTQALSARERLSDVLINKWANRLNIGQLAHYDLRTDAQKAEQAATPIPNELQDLSNGIQALEELESKYGLSTEIVVAHDQGIAITSMEAVCRATADRPVARTGNQIIVLYPNRFGVCLFQHHEMPCRSYVCVGCNEQLAVKGHLPSNQEWRVEADLTYRSVINQLQALITARNRGTADDPHLLDAHLLTLVKEGLHPEGMADELIDGFHELKSQIRDVHFRNELEQAFVARGVVTRLDDPDVANGALIKYHNPKQHGAPGHERALETQFGSREEMDRRSQLFYQQHPELAPQSLNLHDERHLLGDDSDEEDANERAA